MPDAKGASGRGRKLLGSGSKNLRSSIRPPFASERSLVRQFGRVGSSLRDDDDAGAGRHFGTAATELGRYLLSEESALLGPLDAIGPASSPATNLMRRGQRALRGLAIALRNALDRLDRRSALVVVAALRSVLLLREAKRKWVNCPMLAQAREPQPTASGCSLEEA
jgi:hypothetical protein